MNDSSRFIPLPFIRSVYFVGRERGLKVDEIALMRAAEVRAEEYGDLLFVSPQQLVTDVALETLETHGTDVQAVIPLLTVLEVIGLIPRCGSALGEDASPLLAEWRHGVERSLPPSHARMCLQVTDPVPAEDATSLRRALRSNKETSAYADPASPTDALIDLPSFVEGVDLLIRAAMVIEEEPLSTRIQSIAAGLEQQVDIYAN